VRVVSEPVSAGAIRYDIVGVDVYVDSQYCGRVVERILPLSEGGATVLEADCGRVLENARLVSLVHRKRAAFSLCGISIVGHLFDENGGHPYSGASGAGVGQL
jgi:hypothetical protein